MQIDIITMKLLEKKCNLPMDIIRCEIYPLVKYEKLTNRTIHEAVQLYMSDQVECVRRFGRIEDWNTRNVTCMKNLFRYYEDFNADISGWNVSNVCDMSYMFCYADSFNAAISEWDVSNVRDMNHMFYCAKRFDRQTTRNWIMHRCVTRYSMFY